MGEMKRGKGDSEESGYVQIDKTQVLQEAKQCFMATSVKTKKLVDVLTKCIFIMLKGDKLSSTEATDLFFHITRLFQYKDKNSTLRRLTYIGIKALSQQAENINIVTSSLTTDVTSSRDDPAVRASALRALCQISDASTFTTIEQYLRQCVVDKNPVVASAALTSLIRIAQVNGEIVRRCTNEIQEALNSNSPMVQYHALALRYTSCKNDRLATNQLLTTCINQELKSPLAICLLLRILASYINESTSSDDTEKYVAYIRDCLNHRSEMVEFEAASALVSMSQQHKASGGDSLAVARLRNNLTCQRPALRFASVRLLNELAANDLETRSWNIHRIGSLCRLHLLTKRYKPADEIIGLIDFINSSVVCVKYSCILQCEELDQFELKQEFSFGHKQSDFSITIPQARLDAGSGGGGGGPLEPNSTTLHCVLSFLFYIANRDHSRHLYEDKAGTIEEAPNELETKLFSCDFPILVHV